MKSNVNRTKVERESGVGILREDYVNAEGSFSSYTLCLDRHGDGAVKGSVYSYLSPLIQQGTPTYEELENTVINKVESLMEILEELKLAKEELDS